MSMLIPLRVLLSYLLLIASTRAQVSAPNCTNSKLAWVGSIHADASFKSITAHSRIVMRRFHK